MEKAGEEENGVQNDQELKMGLELNEEVPMPTGALKIERLKDLMVAVNEQLEKGETDIMTYTDLYFEWTKFFVHLGKALSVAFKGKSEPMC